MNELKSEEGIGRRAFLKMTGLTGAGLVFGLYLVGEKEAEAQTLKAVSYFEPNAFLKIGSDLLGW